MDVAVWASRIINHKWLRNDLKTGDLKPIFPNFLGHSVTVVSARWYKLGTPARR